MPDLRNVGLASPPGIYCSNKSSHTQPMHLIILNPRILISLSFSSSTLSMSTVRLIGLSCPLHPLIHLIHVHRPSYPLILPSQIFFAHLILVYCRLFHLLILPLCPTASLHPLYPCTLSVPSTYPAPLRPFIHFIHVHYPSHPLIRPH
jgi:hypothetical protein